MKDIKEKKPSVLKKICLVIVYVLLISIIAITLFSYFSRKEGEITNICGYSFSIIMTGSMTDGGFNPGDEVVIKRVNTDTLRKGDIIVFYQQYDSVDNTITKNNITTDLDNGTYIETSFQQTPNSIVLQRSSRENVQKDSSIKMIFHRIINIYEDDYGTRYYETKGDSNNSADQCVREDMVVGKYVDLPDFVYAILNFTTKPLGLFILVVIPLGYVFISQLWEFVRQLKSEIYKRKLFAGKISVMDKKIVKNKVCEKMNDEEKIFLFDITPQKFQPTLARKIWKEDVERIILLREKSRDLYWKYWKIKMHKEERPEMIITKEQARLILEENVSFKDSYNIAVKNLKKDKKDNGNTND